MSDINIICEQLGLGECIASELQMGGSLHQMWFVKTTTGKYSLKQINRKNIALLGDRLLPIRSAQTYAQTQWQLIDGEWLVHDWIDGVCLLPEDITSVHAYELGKLVASVMNDIHHKEALIPKWHIFDEQKWGRFIEQGLAQKKTWSSLYQQYFPVLQEWGKIINAYEQIFTQSLVMSHRDISASNVIWLRNKPTLIDWEFVGLIHPDIECYITLRNFDLTTGEKRSAFECGLGRQFTLSDELCKIGYLGYCLDWLEFNIERSLAFPEQSSIADHQLLLGSKLITTFLLDRRFSAFSHTISLM